MIKYLKVINWKCFEQKDFNFVKENIITKPNGYGKTSIFQAIIFGLFGKMPAGFNLNTLRKDPNKECLVHIEFEYHDKDNVPHSVLVKRQFGKNSLVLVKEDQNVICTSSKEAFAHIDNIYPYDVLSVLWSGSTLSSSNILKPDFLVNSLLDYIFKDAKYLQSYYKKNLFAQNKIVKNLSTKIDKNANLEKDLVIINTEIEELKKSLKKKTSSNDYLINKARLAQEAQEDAKSFIGFEPTNLSLCNKYSSLVKNKDPEKLIEQINLKLKDEENKITSNLFKIPTSSINLIIELSDKEQKCLVCNGDWNEEHSADLKEKLKKGAINFTLIDSLKEQLETLKLDKETIEKSLAYYKIKNTIDECKDFERILNEYDKDNDKMWAKLESLELKKKSIENMILIKNDYILQKNIYDELEEKVNFIEEYIQKANEYYSYTMVEEASIILNKLNPRYDQVFLDEGSYKVSVIDSEMGSMNLLPVVQLSSGEKTLIGISLILSAHKLFLPNIPLLFDESFSALDIENITSLKSLFKSLDIQTFIITHDLFWLAS